MRRKTFDALVSLTGAGMAIVVVVASGLMFWAHSFINDNVRTQLAAQQIFVPPAGSDALKNPAVAPYLTKYAGQQVTNGAQAKAYSDHFIAVHLDKATGGRTYSQLSSAAQAAPDDTALAGIVNTAFRGETLRGLLLSAYAFWQMGQVALIGAWVALVSGLGLLVMAVLGLVHARRTPEDQPVHLPGWHPESMPAS